MTNDHLKLRQYETYEEIMLKSPNDTTIENYSFELPAETEWLQYITPHWSIAHPKGKRPNILHRYMQYIFFGWKWKKYKE